MKKTPAKPAAGAKSNTKTGTKTTTTSKTASSTKTSTKTQNKDPKTVKIDKAAFVSHEQPKIKSVGPVTSLKGNCIKTIQAHEDSIEALIAFDDARIISAGLDGVIKLWNIQELGKLAKPVQQFKGHEDAVFSVIKFTNSKIISCSRDKTIRVWNIESGKQLGCITGKEPYFIVKQVSDAQVAASGGDSEIRVFNLCNEGDEIPEDYVLSGQSNVVRSLEIFPNNLLCSAGEDTVIFVWDCANRTLVTKLEGHSDGINCLHRLKDDTLASGSNDMTIKIWDLQKKACIATLSGGTDKIMSVNQLPDGRIISGGSEWNLVVWSKENKIENEIEGHEGSINGLIALPNGMVVTGSADNTLKFWK